MGIPSPPCLKEPTPCGFHFSSLGASARPRFGPFLRSPGHRLQCPPFQYNTSLMGLPLKRAHTSLPHHPLRETTALGVEETGSLESKPRLSLARRSKEMLLPRPAPSLPLLSFPSPCLFFLLRTTNHLSLFFFLSSSPAICTHRWAWRVPGPHMRVSPTVSGWTPEVRMKPVRGPPRKSVATGT